MNDRSTASPPIAPRPGQSPGTTRSQVFVAMTVCGATVTAASIYLPGSLSPIARRQAPQTTDGVTTVNGDFGSAAPWDSARLPSPTVPRPAIADPSAGPPSPPGPPGPTSSSPSTSAVVVIPGTVAPGTEVPGTAVPGAVDPQVRSMTARPGAGQVSVSWSLTGSLGSMPMTVTVSAPDGPTAKTCPPRAHGCIASGLTPGVRYTVTLTIGRVRAHASAVPFPADLGTSATRLWFDASAPDGVEAGATASGSPVRRVADRSRSDADAVATSGLRPPTLTTLAGHRALNFRSGSGLAFPARSLPSGDAPSTVYVVAKSSDAAPEQECFAQALSWGAAKEGRARIVGKGCTTSLAFADTFGTWLHQQPSKRWFSGSTQVIRAGFAPKAISVWVDGAFSYRWPTPKGALNTTQSASGTLGGVHWDPNISWRGAIGEVIVLSDVPTAAQDQAITDYLTRKWTP